MRKQENYDFLTNMYKHGFEIAKEVIETNHLKIEPFILVTYLLSEYDRKCNYELSKIGRKMIDEIDKEILQSINRKMIERLTTQGREQIYAEQ